MFIKEIEHFPAANDSQAHSGLEILQDLALAIAMMNDVLPLESKKPKGGLWAIFKELTKVQYMYNCVD